MEFIGVTSLRKQLSRLVQSSKRIVITKGGRPEAVLLPLEDYRALMVTQALARNPEDLAQIVAAHNQVLSGDLSETQLHSKSTSSRKPGSGKEPKSKSGRKRKTTKGRSRAQKMVAGGAG